MLSPAHMEDYKTILDDTKRQKFEDPTPNQSNQKQPPHPTEAGRPSSHQTHARPSVLTELDSNFKGIMLEHCYARPYNWRPESSFLRPTKTLFVTSASKKKAPGNPLAPGIPRQHRDDPIDVETVVPEAPIIYDVARARKLMDECERHAAFAREDAGDDDWEEKISRTNWTPGQNHLFNIMANILNSDRMSRLAYAGVHNEPILRRTVVENSVRRFRQLMAKYSWDNKLAQWLHQLLIDNLSTAYLACYLDVLQTLKHKMPMFVDKLMFGPNSHGRTGAMSNEGLYPLLKRPWDPVASSLNQDKPKKLPGNPVIIIVPSAPSTSASMYSKRLHRWINLFSNLATVCTVYNNIGTNGSKLTMMNCVDQMFAATRAKIQEIKAEYPNRPIVLAGFNAGSALALQVAQVETVLCILCLGFSIHTAEGNRGEPDDNLLELQCPVFFVIGQCSNTALQENMEDVRERMRVETGLLVVGSADDFLRVNKKKKRMEGITQSVVDRCIVDEVGEFVSGLLLSPYPPQLRQSPAHLPLDVMKRPKVERKRNNSNGSSLDSEPPSPTPRISRPVGRPPGSKAKSKIEAKWHAMQQGIPPPIPISSSSSSQSTNSNVLDDSLSDPAEPFSEPVKKHSVTEIETVDKPAGVSANLSPQGPAKLQALGIPPGRNIYHGSQLSNLLQGGVRTLPPNPPGKQIKVLENLTISATGTANKMLTVPGRTIDMSKMTVLNPSNPSKMGVGGSFGNVMLMPDGKLKASGPAMRGTLTKPKTNTPAVPTTTTPSVAKASLTKYITSKKQLLANRNKQVKKMPYISPSPSAANLLPPTNLTSQDIMDLPIIFADDNQMLANNTIQPSDTPSVQIVQPAPVKPNACGKLVFLNKQQGVIKQNVLKRPSPSAVKNANPIKYAKIILSKAPSNEEANKKGVGPKVIPAKDIDSPPITTDTDLESELIGTTITKPNFVPNDPKNLSLVYKSSELGKAVSTTDSSAKGCREMDLEDSDDPEYEPSKADL